MEAVARQFGNQSKCLVIRNGWFSYRWSQIFEAGDFYEDLTIVKARQKVMILNRRFHQLRLMT